MNNIRPHTLPFRDLEITLQSLPSLDIVDLIPETTSMDFDAIHDMGQSLHSYLHAEILCEKYRLDPTSASDFIRRK